MGLRREKERRFVLATDEDATPIATREDGVLTVAVDLFKVRAGRAA